MFKKINKNKKILSEGLLIVLIVSILTFQYWHDAKTASEDKAIKMLQSRYKSNVLAGENFTVTVGLKNVGSTIWQKTGEHQVEMKIAEPWDRQSVLASPRWIDSVTVAKLSSNRCLPGRIAYFVLPLTAPLQAGKVSESFVLVKNSTETIPGSEFTLEFNVAETLAPQEDTAADLDSNSDAEEPSTAQPEITAKPETMTANNFDERTKPTGIELSTLEKKELTMDEICQTFSIDSITGQYFDRYLNYCLLGRTIRNSYGDNSVNTTDILNDPVYLMWRRNPNPSQ